MRTLIKHAHCILPHETVVADVLIDGDKIARVGAPAGTVAEEIIDARGRYLLPGVIDDQVHFREPGLTHKEDLRTASRACAAGGVTSFLEMPNTVPNATTQQRIEQKLALAAEKSLVNFGFYIGATPDNLEELRHAHRTPGVKIFIGSSTGDLLVNDQSALERIFAETTLPLTAHCEDEATVRSNRQTHTDKTDVSVHSKIRDHAAARIATKRAIELAKRYRHRFHVLHVSTRDEIPLIADHERLITGEVCPHHLFFNVDDYPRLGTRIQMNPSVKLPEDNAALWEALLSGVIQVIATDHAPHTLEEKAADYPQSPSGLPAVENSLALLLNEVNRGRCTMEQVVGWMCDAPARVWDLVGKGRIVEGYDADLVLVDLHLTKTIRDEEQLTKSKWSPWDGVELTGWPVRTWVLGRQVYANGVLDEHVRGREIVYDHQLGGYWATED